MAHRWSSYVSFEDRIKVSEFTDYLVKRGSSLLFVMGCGFDPRMNNILKQIISQNTLKNITCVLIHYRANQKMPEDVLYDANAEECSQICMEYGINIHDVFDNHPNDIEKRIVSVLRSLRSLEYSQYTDIVVDVSALPRALYFNICKFFYKKCEDNKKNLFFAVSENVEIDTKIIDKTGDEIYPMRGFGRNYRLEAFIDKRTILVPLLGEHHAVELKKIYANFKPVDVCPILPFPSVNPRRSEEVLGVHKDFFEEIDQTEPQNFTYADERNPFELYGILTELMRNYKKTLEPLTTCVCFGIAVLNSKLMSLGALLVGLETPDEVSFYSSSPISYNVSNLDEMKRMNANSKSYIMWITGEAYDD